MANNKQHVRWGPTKVRHCSITDETEASKEIMSLPPPLARTRVSLSAHAAGTCHHSPLMLDLKFNMEHRSFNEMLIGVFENPRMLLCIRSGWVPTSVLLIPIIRRHCFPKCVSAPEVDSTPIVCEETYRSSYFKCQHVYADVKLEREHHQISTHSIDLYVFVRDLFILMGIQTKLQFVP